MPLLKDLHFALRSLARAKGLSIAVVLTLALGIGANAAIFSVVRGVLFRPLVNRDEGRLIYIQQSAPGIGTENTTFSVPEIRDLRGRVRTVESIGEFSTITFTMVGLGEPRTVVAGVVDGNYFDVVGLRPVLGRLLNVNDEGPSAAGAAVLTHRFWTTGLNSDPAVLGKTIRLGTRSATIVGVLEPSDPYPAATELIANMVTSPHHLSATMVEGREHRMTQVFGRLAPGADLQAARSELRTVHSAIIKEHAEAYSPKAEFQIDAVLLRDQITSRARTMLLILLGASGLVFIIACSNVANLILARTVRREGELALRAALGAGRGALRRVLLAESVLLCGIGAAVGIAAAWPMFSVLSRYASRLSVRALDLKLDSSALWVGAALALASAVLLAFVPRLPSADASHGIGLTSGGLRITGGTKRRLRVFAVIQIAASFVLLTGAGMLLNTLIALQATSPGFETESVLAVNVPVVSFGKTPEQIRAFYRDLRQRLISLPGVEHVAVGGTVPWRDAGSFGPGWQFWVAARARENGQEGPRARFRSVSPGFFAALGIRQTAGRDFNDADRNGAERVVIISQSIADKMFPGEDPVNRHLMWIDPIMQFINISTAPRRIVGVVPDIDDERVDPQSVMTIYHPFEQEIGGGRLFIHAKSDPYALIPVVTRVVRDMSTDQPVERASTLDDVRAEVLTPERLNTMVFGGFAAVALAISIVGVSGVLAFSVSARTREFGIRLAIGSEPSHLLRGVLAEGVIMAALGVASGTAIGLVLYRVLASYLAQVQFPGLLPILGAALLLVIAAASASLLPAARAARVDVMEALRME
jgi:putative ABC transport system permease protein